MEEDVGWRMLEGDVGWRMLEEEYVGGDYSELRRTAVAVDYGSYYNVG